MRSVAFSPDGKTIVSGSNDKTIKVWDAGAPSPAPDPSPIPNLSAPTFATASLELKAEKQSAHSDVVRSVAFLPEGKTIVSGSWDKTLKVWEVLEAETGAPVPLEVLEVRQELSKFTAAGSGVQFLHARVMVRGPGGAGKSATIEALAGKEFNASQMSTVGVGVDELELNHRELQLGRGDGVLKAYDRAAGEGEYVRAIAANAAAVLAGTATATGGSMLAKVEVREGVHPAKLRRDVAAAKEASPSSVSKLRVEVAEASSPAAASSSPAEASSSVPAKQAAAAHP